MIDRRAIRRKAANVVFVGFCAVVTADRARRPGADPLVAAQPRARRPRTSTSSPWTTPAPGSRGGLRNAIVGSIMMCALGMVIAVVVGILAGTWLAEYGGDSRYGNVVRFLNDVLLSAPSILVGLFVYELLVAPFHGFSGFAGAVALALLAVPVVTRTTEDVLKLQPTPLREAGVALGAPLWPRDPHDPLARGAARHPHRRPAGLRPHQRRDRAAAVHRR